MKVTINETALNFVSRSGEVTERPPQDWLDPEFAKSMGEFLIHFLAKS